MIQQVFIKHLLRAWHLTGLCVCSGEQDRYGTYTLWRKEAVKMKCEKGQARGAQVVRENMLKAKQNVCLTRYPLDPTCLG